MLRVAETGSTNADLLALAADGEPPGLVLVTDHQTAGKGRLGRGWSAPPGASLLVSVLLSLPAGAPVHGATWAVGLAGRDACAEVTGVVPELKWPNDLMVGERKLAGILAEAVVAGGGVVDGVVVGMGLNVSWPAATDLPGELAERVVALNHVTGSPVDREAVLDAYLRHLGGRVAEWEEQPDELVDAYRGALGTLGREVRVELAGETLVGMAVDVDHEGALVVVRAGGERHVVRAGDVVHLRPA